jgi:hypothetical protein
VRGLFLESFSRLTNGRPYFDCCVSQHDPHRQCSARLLRVYGLVGGRLNPHHHPQGRFVSWWTHFALLSIFDNVEKYKLERMDGHENVVFRRVDGLDEFAGNAIETIAWSGWKDRNDVEAFVKEQRKHRYDFVGKNCQYFAYDFFRYCLDDARADGAVENFTELCQSHFRERS